MIEKQARRLMQAGDVSGLISLLNDHPGIEQLELGGGVLGKMSDRELETLTQALRYNTTIHKLYLHNNKLKDVGAEKIARMLELNNSIMQLYLGGNDIQDQGAIALARALKVNKSLQHINLHSNNIGDVGVRALAEALLTGSIRQLYLGANKIGDAGGQSLLELVKANQRITELDLDGFRGGIKADIERHVAANVKRAHEDKRVRALEQILASKEEELLKARQEMEAEKAKRARDFEWLKKLSDPYGKTVFLLAIEQGDFEFAKELIGKHRGFLSSTTIEGENGFLLSIKLGHFEFAQYLLSVDLQLMNSVDTDGNNAFLLATKAGQIRVVQALLALSPSFVESTNRFGNNAFLLAIESDNYQLVEYFLQIKPSVLNSINHSGTNAFLSAIAGNNWAIAEKMISLNPLFISTRDKSGNDGALIAAWHGRGEILQTLLQRNPNFIRSEDNGSNNLFLAAVGNGNFELGHRLLRFNPHFINSVNKHGESAKTFGYQTTLVSHCRPIYANPLLNCDLGGKIITEACKRGLVDRILELSNNPDTGLDILSYSQKHGLESLFKLFSQQESLELIEVRMRGSNDFYDQDMLRLKSILAHYGIDMPIEQALTAKGFRQLSLKLHPDKGGNKEDFAFVSDLKARFDEGVDVESDADSVVRDLQLKAHKLSVYLKSLDTAVDAFKLYLEPTAHNLKAVALDAAHLSSMTLGFSKVSSAATLLSVGHTYYSEGLAKAASQGVVSLGYMTVPYALTFTGIPYVGFVYSVGIAVYSAYHAVNNAYALYSEYTSEQSELRSTMAYMNAFKWAVDTFGAQWFEDKAKEYEIKLNSIKLHMEQEAYQMKLQVEEEFGQKLYEHIYEQFILI